jgi:hypothetical protein
MGNDVGPGGEGGEYKRQWVVDVMYLDKIILPF